MFFIYCDNIILIYGSDLKMYQILLLGDPNVGKSEFKLSILERLDADISTRLHGDFVITIISSKDYAVSLWDFQSDVYSDELIDAGWNNFDCVFLLYDITQLGTFFNLSNWLDIIYKEPYNSDMVVSIVGNKIDLRKGSHKEVTMDQVNQVIPRLTKEYDHDLEYFESSSVIGSTPRIIFDQVMNKIIPQEDEEETEEGPHIVSG